MRRKSRHHSHGRRYLRRPRFLSPAMGTKRRKGAKTETCIARKSVQTPVKAHCIPEAVHRTSSGMCMHKECYLERFASACPQRCPAMVGVFSLKAFWSGSSRCRVVGVRLPRPRHCRVGSICSHGKPRTERRNAESRQQGHCDPPLGFAGRQSCTMSCAASPAPFRTTAPFGESVGTSSLWCGQKSTRGDSFGASC